MRIFLSYYIFIDKKGAVIILRNKIVLTGVLALSISCLQPVFTYAAEKPALDLQTEAVYLINPKTHEVLFQKNQNEEIPAASVTKVMTMTLAAEALKDKKVKEDDKVKISEKAWLLGGSRMFLEVGTEYPFIELYKGMAVVSGNDAALATAEHLAGTEEKFVDDMNKKAKKLGMKNTTYMTANGFPQGNKLDKTSAKDQAILADYYLKNFPEKMKIHNAKEYTTKTRLNPIKQFNTNELIGKYEGMTGLKTGFIDGHSNIVATADRNGIPLIAVLLKSPNSSVRDQETKEVLDYGFSQYKIVNKGKKGETVDDVHVFLSDGKKNVPLVLKENANVMVHIKDEDKVEVEFDVPPYVTGDQKKGTVVGKQIVTVNGKKSHTFDVALGEDLPSAAWYQYIFDNVAKGFVDFGMTIKGWIKG